MMLWAKMHLNVVENLTVSELRKQPLGNFEMSYHV